MIIDHETVMDPTPVPTGDRVADSARTTYRRLLMSGLSTREAGNLTAHLAGIHTVAKGWNIEEIEHLLFVRDMVDRGRLGS